MDKKKILLFAGLFLAMAGGLFLSYKLSVQTVENTKNVDKPKTHETQPKAQKPTEPSTTEEEEPKEVNSDNLQTIYEQPKDNKSHASQSEALSYSQFAREKFRELRFLDGLKELDKGIEKFSNKGDGALLYQLQADASILANIIPPPDQEISQGEVPDEEDVKNVFKLLQDPEMALLGALGLDDYLRGKVILNKDSLNPLFEGKVLVQDMSEVKEGAKYDAIKSVYEDAQIVYNIRFNLEGHSLNGYVIRFADGHVSVHSIENVEGETSPYKTTAEWEEYYKKFNLTPSYNNKNFNPADVNTTETEE